MRRAVHPDLLRIRRTDALQGEVERVRELLAGSRQDAPATTAALTTAHAEELVGEVRAARDAR